MSATVYNLKSDASQSGQLLGHQNTSGGNQRVIINYVRMKEMSSVNGYLTIQFGTAGDLCSLQVNSCTAFGKHVAYLGDKQSTGTSGHNLQGFGGADADHLTNAPTEIMLAENQYFIINWYGPNYVDACNIVVLPE
tara:strand:- start:475 stop:882 length:408 start_codon:yes stop_codon:yes gene_type:complete